MLTPTILAELRAAVGVDGLIIDRNQLQTYECDGLAVLRSLPAAVVLPRSTAQVQAVIQVCARHRIPFVGRGAGTGLSGGALPDDRGIVISFARMTKVLDIDIPNQRVTVEAGVINAHVTQRVTPAGHFYAPDPSSQSVCTIGGNVAENSGGRPLPQVRLHHQPRTGSGSGFAHWRTGPPGLAHAGCARLRSGWGFRGF